MAKYVSGRVKDLKVGVSDHSESKVSLNVIGVVSATSYVALSTVTVGTAITMDAATGIVTAKSFKGPGGVDATFVGDGSGLTNIVGSGSGIVVRDSDSLVGTAGTIDF